MAAADGIRCMLMRGGTSKGAYFVADDLPADPAERDDVLLRVMGSPDPRQIDGLGGAHPLTSKVAVISRSGDSDADLDYLFLQVVVDRPVVSDRQTCGNLLAGVGPFGIERGLVAAGVEQTPVRIRLVNTGDIAHAVIHTPGGIVDYRGETSIDGVPGVACAIDLEVTRSAPLLPTGAVLEEIEGHAVTLIDNGMPIVVVRADALGVRGDEEPEELEARPELRRRVEEIRLAAGARMGLGDVGDQTVPKVFLVSRSRAGGALSTRGFIPDRVHQSIGVLMAASIAAAARIPGTVAAEVSDALTGDVCLIEHPSGLFPARARVEQRGGQWYGTSFSERTARKIFDGTVFPRP